MAFFPLGEAPQDLADEVGAGPVVEGAGDADRAVDELKGLVIDGGIADGDALESLLLGFGPDIDPDLVGFGNLFPVLGSHEVDGAFSGDAFDGTFSGQDDDASTGDHAAIVAAEGFEINIAAFIDVGDDQAEFVDVPGHHEAGVALGIQSGDPVAHGILAVIIGDGLEVAVDDGLCLKLMSCRRTGIQKIHEELGSGILLLASGFLCRCFFCHCNTGCGISRYWQMETATERTNSPTEFRIFPAIDLKGGRVVRLSQGREDRETVYFDDPLEPARKFREAGAAFLHVVDLDGAFRGLRENQGILEQLAGLGLFLQTGGGIRCGEDVERVLELGVSRVVLGTRALEAPEFVAEMVDRFGDQIAVGIDAKNGKVATRGWVDVSEKDAVDFAREVSALGVRALIYTDISTDGMLTGPNLDAQMAMAEALPADVELVASGGVSRAEDVDSLKALFRSNGNPQSVIIGRALYEGRLDLEEVVRR